jgi:hypothetical protein
MQDRRLRSSRTKYPYNHVIAVCRVLAGPENFTSSPHKEYCLVWLSPGFRRRVEEVSQRDNPAGGILLLLASDLLAQTSDEARIRLYPSSPIVASESKMKARFFYIGVAGVAQVRSVRHGDRKFPGIAGTSARAGARGARRAAARPPDRDDAGAGCSRRGAASRS